MKKQIFKGENLTRTKVKNNILAIYNQCTEQDKFDWYQDAHNFAIKLSEESGYLTVTQCCGIISALSPMTSWEQNKKLARLSLTTAWDKMPCLKANSKKAMKIRCQIRKDNDSDILDVLRGDKVSSFFLNILYPQDAISITIDRHALSICLGRWLTDDQMKSMTPLQYKFFEECYRWTAVKLGINPLLLQSATWVKFRKIKKQYL